MRHTLPLQSKRASYEILLIPQWKAQSFISWTQCSPSFHWSMFFILHPNIQRISMSWLAHSTLSLPLSGMACHGRSSKPANTPFRLLARLFPYSLPLPYCRNDGAPNNKSMSMLENLSEMILDTIMHLYLLSGWDWKSIMTERIVIRKDYRLLHHNIFLKHIFVFSGMARLTKVNV